MNIRQLRLFHLVATSGSFTAAAREEGVTVQAVSKSIHELERELGGELFTREGRTMRPTALAQAILEPARDAVEGLDAVTGAARAWNEGARDERRDLKITLVTPPFAKHEFICGIIARLMARSLGTETSLRVSVGARALASMHAGAVDALVTVGALDAPGCGCTPFGSVAPGVFLGRNHPLQRRGTLSFRDLAPYPVLWNDEIDGFNETVLVACRRRGLASPIERIETNEEVVDFLERRRGYIMGVNLKALSMPPFAMMHGLDPDEAPAVPICLVLPEGPHRPEVERLDRFCRNEFSLLKRLLGSEGTITGY